MIAWIDTDIVNIHPRFVYGIIGPLLLERNVQFVKGFYRRPLKVGHKVQAGGGGRVTELTARPLINLFYPELSGVIQPLSGEYAGRRTALEQTVFFSGYGVETGLLIDIFECYGLRAIAQVDLLERIHHNQGLEALSKMSFQIIQTVLRKLESRYERAILAAPKNLRIIPDPRLREINQGEWEGQLVYVIQACYGELWQQRSIDPANFRPPCGETIGEVARRVFAALDDIAARHIGGSVLVVSHGLSLATAICRIRAIPLGQAYNEIPENTTPVWLDWNPENAGFFGQ